MIGFAMCGSFCTHKKAVEQLKALLAYGYEVQPIMSENVYSTDTYFGTCESLKTTVIQLCGRDIIHTVVDAEPLGPKISLEALAICPCTGNTLAKMANGITDTAVTMAAKAHLRCDRPMLIALASNDAMSQNLYSIATLVNRKSVYLLPMVQDDPRGKPHSLIADFTKMSEGYEAMTHGVQLRPLFL